MTVSQQTAPRQQTYTRARSHSRRVRLLKVFVSAAAVAGTLAVAFVIFWPKAIPTLDAAVSGSAIVDGKLVMADPKLDGYTPDNRAYRVTATRAVQDLQGDGGVLLETLRANVELENGVNASLVSDEGVYDNDRNILDLTTPSRLEMTDGTDARMTRATVDMATGSVQARDGVDIRRDANHIRSATMTIENNGKRVVFDGGVRLVMTPEKADKQASETTGSAN